ncbi:zinc finger protein [Moniliophthora roreri MCA 2997]|uniref:Zinc finger protein n=2 Tax=Moniliophthora roreri TaxID=221103 RepID=V2WXU1_MONRO|nr:zinc finger protein [Moniliophthora roreri MCA 2997]KAI3597456.1 zinc finger protein [Moniliophthora roreri]
MAFKRPRHPSESSSDSSFSPSTSPTPKASRTLPTSNQATHQLLCTLPPTCNQKPTPIANTKDLEAHYATYHAHVCEQRGCGCVFPDARFLELHQTECHDPLAAVRKDRGEKIFACFLPLCSKSFANPKARRLHLIQVHAYPKEYFFAVTNKGVGGLLQKWGEGASMIRGQWKKRETGEEGADEEPSTSESMDDTNDGNETDQTERQSATASRTSVTKQTRRKVNVVSGASSEHGGTYGDDADMDQLADSMTSLSLVPGSVRFGRGASKGGFLHQSPHQGTASNFNRGSGRARGGRGGRARGVGQRAHASGGHSEGMEVDPNHSSSGRGRYRGKASIPMGGVTSGRGGISSRRGAAWSPRERGRGRGRGGP